MSFSVHVRRALIAAFILLMTGNATEVPPPPREFLAAQDDNQTLMKPIATIKREDVLKAGLSGMGVAAKMARKGNAVFLVSEGVVVAMDASKAAIEEKDKVTYYHLGVISNNQRMLEILKRDGKLRVGDPAYDAIRAELERELKTLPRGTSLDFFKAAISSPAGLLAAGRVGIEHYVGSYFGEKIAGKLGLGGAIRRIGLERLSQSRAVPRVTWQNLDSLSRGIARLTDEVVKETIKETLVTAANGGGAPPPCGTTITVGGGPTLSYGPSGMTMRIEPGYPVYFPCPDEIAPPPTAARIIVPARAVEQIVFAAPARALPLPPPLPLAQSAPRAVRGHQEATYGDITPYAGNSNNQYEYSQPSSPTQQNSQNNQNQQNRPSVQFKEGTAWRQAKSISISGNWPR